MFLSPLKQFKGGDHFFNVHFIKIYQAEETLQAINILGNCFSEGRRNGQFNYIGECALISLISQLTGLQIA